MPKAKEAIEADTGSSSSSTELSTFEFLEKSGKFALGALAVLYCGGLFITNVSLISLGITDFSSFKAKYVLTGMWPLLSVLVFCIPWLARAEAAAKLKKPYKLKDHWELLKPTIFGFALSVVAFYSVFVRFLEVKFGIAIVYFSMLTLLSWGIVQGILFGREVADSVKERQLVIVAWLLLALGFGGIMMIDPNLYFLIPQQLGGGKPHTVRLILTDEGSKVWEQLHTADKPGKVDIYYETESELVLKLGFEYTNPGGDKMSARLPVILRKPLVQATMALPEPGQITVTATGNATGSLTK